jgi:hypothetical protein
MISIMRRKVFRISSRLPSRPLIGGTPMVFVACDTSGRRARRYPGTVKPVRVSPVEPLAYPLSWSIVVHGMEDTDFFSMMESRLSGESTESCGAVSSECHSELFATGTLRTVTTPRTQVNTFPSRMLPIPSKQEMISFHGKTR